MKAPPLLLVLVIAAAGCTRVNEPLPAPVDGPEPPPPDARPQLVFQATCVSVWDVAIDGTWYGLTMFTAPDQSVSTDLPAGVHHYEITRWAPEPVTVLRDSVVVSGESVRDLPCS